MAIREYDIKNKIRYLDSEAQGVVKSTKYFPVFEELGEEKIFKPLSKTKPYSTPLFAYSEVYWSYLIKKYIDKETPQYHIAICHGLEKEQPKYYEKGTIVKNILKKDEKLINLLELFKKYPDSVDINEYVNYCEVQYDYETILKSKFFMEHKDLGEGLAKQILCSILRRDDNFHYENVNFIEKNNEIIKIAPIIDQEFSQMFMHPDNLEKHKEKFSLYDEGMGPIYDYNDDFNFDTNYSLFLDKLNNGSIYDELDPCNYHNLRKNIKTITELYPKMCEEFLKQLKKLRLEVLNLKIDFNDEYLDTFSSIDWIPTRMLLKENKKESDEEYIKALNNSRNSKIKLDKIEFNKRLKKEVVWSIDKLLYILKLYLDINKGKSSAILDYQNKTLYDKVERIDEKNLNEVYK